MRVHVVMCHIEALSYTRIMLGGVPLRARAATQQGPLNCKEGVMRPHETLGHKA